MGEIIIMGLHGGGTVLPITATKHEIVGAMFAKCGHEDLKTYEELRAGLLAYLFDQETYNDNEEK